MSINNKLLIEQSYNGFDFSQKDIQKKYFLNMEGRSSFYTESPDFFLIYSNEFIGGSINRSFHIQ